ncbi:hypothetical protein [Neobacillus drentensis]|uniref:hypothetical protein n=1 Tax=Neobacillus drentensis TaxID=220684 RepID=UPI003000650A
MVDWLSGPLAVGTWVTLDSGLLKNFTGFITKYNYEEEQYRIQLTLNAEGKQTEGHLWVFSENVIPAPVIELDEIDLQSLIDITLFLKEKEWFLEIASQLLEETTLVK